MNHDYSTVSNVDAVDQKMFRFILRDSESSRAGLRLAELLLRDRPKLSTPTFVIPTSRGVIPHVTHDLLGRLPEPYAVYIGLEDFVEKSPSKAPLLQRSAKDNGSTLRDFTALPDHCVSIFGPRRVPAIETPSHNSNSSVAISTSVGFQSLAAGDYSDAALSLRSDITVGLADVVTADAISQKRKEKSADRTHAWTRDMLAARADVDNQAPFFASIPPLEQNEQSFYLSDLSDEYRSDISGLTLYSADTAIEIPKLIDDLPRLCLINPKTPQEVLRAIALGNDLITIPFVTDSSETGIAMNFSFAPDSALHDAPLGIDLADKSYDRDTKSLLQDCDCYTCQRHHRAYIHHLLSAKEMLAWTLLQVHNLHVLSTFFSQVRASIHDSTFEDKQQAFARAYQSEMPQPQGEGPRIRGYQMKSIGGGEPKKNKKVYGRLDEHAMKLEEANSGIATPESDSKAEDLEKQGLGEVQ